MEDFAIHGHWGGHEAPGRFRCKDVLKWISSVFGTEKLTFLVCAMALRRPEAPCRDLLFER